MNEDELRERIRRLERASRTIPAALLIWWALVLAALLVLVRSILRN